MNTSLPWQTQRAIREGMSFSAVVDINGVHNPKTGGFHVILDAMNAGHKSIFVRDGTYPPEYWAGTYDAVSIYGESWDVIIDGGTTAHALEIDGTTTNLFISNLSLKTTSGAGNAYDCIKLQNGVETFNTFHRLQIIESDQYGFCLNGHAAVALLFCVSKQSDNEAVWGNSSTHWLRTIGCDFATAGTGSTWASHGDTGVVAGNIVRGTLETLSASYNMAVIGNLCDVETVGGSSHTHSNEVNGGYRP